jgi:predicted metal-dependent enzyme (double-stranded beta helix superfamily)
MLNTKLTADLGELEKFTGLPPTLALEKAIPVLERLVEDPAFRGSEILPLLEEAGGVNGWYVACRYNGKDRDCSLQLFVWPPGSGTKIHDHASWGALRCVAGSILEERYERVDDGPRPNRARLRMIWRRTWSRENRPSTVLPYEGGIHRITNPGPDTAISVHLYGPRMGRLDGWDYDPSREYVCDREEERGFAGCVKQTW